MAPTKKAASPTRLAFKNTAKAQEAARAGKIDAAIASLRHFADEGDILASCSLAALLGFRGEWDEVLLRVQPLLAKPDTAYANVLLDMVGLLWRAAEETGRWRDAGAALAKLPKKYAKEFVLIARLGPYFAAAGKGARPALDHGPGGTPAQRKAKFAREVTQARDQNDAFLLFAASDDDPMFDEHAIATFAAARKDLDLRNTLFAAKAFVRQNRPDEAWKALAPKLVEWTEDEEAQIAPAQLLYDPGLRPMMTPARCEKVLVRNA